MHDNYTSSVNTSLSLLYKVVHVSPSHSDCFCSVTLIVMTGCVYVELVRCPEHSDREGPYVITLVQDILCFHHPTHLSAPVMFRWRLNHIRRSQYYKLVNKLEIEVGR